jgi:hypothetical protein
MLTLDPKAAGMAQWIDDCTYLKTKVEPARRQKSDDACMDVDMRNGAIMGASVNPQPTL